jgi:hypothetical protein
LEEEVAVCEIIKFFAIVALDKTNRKKKMCGHILLKVEKNSVNIRLVA